MNEEKSQNPKTTEQQTDLEEQYKGKKILTRYF